jgi:hypothetical protein
MRATVSPSVSVGRRTSVASGVARPREARGILGDTSGSVTDSETRYHLLATDGGIVADQPGKIAGEAAIGVVLKAPLEEISEPIGAVPRKANAEADALARTPLGPLRPKPKPPIDELPLD